MKRKAKCLFSIMLIMIGINFSFAQYYINEVIVKPGTSALGAANQSLYYPASTPFGSEGVELYNPGCDPLNISHYLLVFKGAGTLNEGIYRFPSGTTIAIGGFLTIGGPGTSASNSGSDVAAASMIALTSTTSSTYFLHSDANRLYMDNPRGYVALYDASGTPLDCVYWHGSATGEGASSWGDATSGTNWLSSIGANGTIPSALIPAGDVGAPVVASLPGPSSAALTTVKRCAGYLDNAGVQSAQNQGDGQPTIQSTTNLSYGSSNNTATGGTSATCIVLPLNWLSVISSCSKTFNTISWTVSEQVNNKVFEVLKSLDGMNFNIIGTVAGEKDYAVAKTYKFIDSNGDQGATNIYYKVRQVDYNGKSSDSKIVSCGGENGIAISILSNPFTNEFTIKNESGNIFQVEVYDAIGRKVGFIQNDNKEKQLMINSTTWSDGVYTAQVFFSENRAPKAIKAIKVNN